MKRIAWGVLSTAKIGTQKVIPGMLVGTRSTVAATQLMRYQKVHILGTTGRIELEIPFNAPPGEPTRIFVEDGASGKGPEVIEIEPCDQYTLQGDEAARVFLDEIPAPYPIEDGVLNMRVLDSLYRSARTGNWEVV